MPSTLIGEPEFPANACSNDNAGVRRAHGDAPGAPVGDQLPGWSLATLPSDWEQIRARWADFHTVRTFLALGAVAAAIGAALANRPREAARG